MGLGDVIKRARLDARLSQEALGARIGVTGVAVGQWEKGKTVPSGANTLRLIDLLGIDPAEIFAAQPLPVGREGRGNYARAGRPPAAPLYGRIAAGVPIEKLPVEDELWVYPDAKREHPRAFFLEVRGESMNRVIPNGSFALVDPDAHFVDGDVMAVSVNGRDATIKRVYRGADAAVLAPDSYDTRFEEQRITDPDEVTPIGRVVWWMPCYGRRL